MSSSHAANLRARFEELNTVTSRDAAALAAQGQRATIRLLVCRPFSVFLRSYFAHHQWKKGVVGLVESIFAAYEVFVRYAKLWELHNSNTEPMPPPRA